MRKILFLFVLISSFAINAQDGPYLVRTHEIRVEGNVADFIDAQKIFTKKLQKMQLKEKNGQVGHVFNL